MNQALSSMYGGSLEITFTVPLISGILINNLKKGMAMSDE